MIQILRERQMRHNETKNDANILAKRSKPKTSIDQFLDLSKTDPTFTEHELISELNVLILAVSLQKHLQIRSKIFY